MLQLHAVAIAVHFAARESGGAGFRRHVVEIVKTQPADLVLVSQPSIDQIDSRRHAAFAADVEMPAGKQPGVLVFPGFLVMLSAQHHAVSVEQEWPPAGARARDEMVAELGVERLAQVGKPEKREVARVEPEVFHNDLLLRIDRDFLGAHPEIRVLRVVRGDAGVLTHEYLLTVPVLGGKFPRFQQNRIQPGPQPAGIHGLLLVIIYRPLAALEDVSLINTDVPQQRRGLGLEIHHHAVRVGLHPVVAGDLDARALVMQSDVLSSLNRPAAVVADLQALRHREGIRPRRAERNFRLGHRCDQIHGRRTQSPLREDLLFLGTKRPEQQRGNDPCTKFQHRRDKRTPRP